MSSFPQKLYYFIIFSPDISCYLEVVVVDVTLCFCVLMNFLVVPQIVELDLSVSLANYLVFLVFRG